MKIQKMIKLTCFLPAVISCVATGCSSENAVPGDYIYYDRPDTKVETVLVNSLEELQQAIENAPSEGRFITLAVGEYEQYQTIKIEGKYNITIQGETSSFEDTVLKGPGIDAGSMHHNVQIKDSKYITIKNLTLQDSYYHAIQVNKGSDYFYACNLKTWDNGESGFKVSSSNEDGFYSDFGMIEDCYIGFTETGRRSVIEGIDIVGGKGWIIRGNKLVNITSSDDNMAYGIFAKGNSQDTIIERNFLKDCDIAISLGGGGTGKVFFRDGDTSLEHRNGIIRNNVVWSTRDTGIYLNKASNYKIFNNTIWSSKDYPSSIESRFPGSTGVIVNNICSKEITDRDGGVHTEENNLVNAASDLFEDVRKGNFQLVENAKEAVGKGKPLKEKENSSDFNGKCRPKDSGCDIGAFER